MMIHQITAQAGADRRPMRVGRGRSGKRGKTCGRGQKGGQSRAGGGSPFLHIGGSMPLFRRAPMRGFNNYNFRVEYEPVNLGTLSERFAKGEKVDGPALAKAGLISKAGARVKILGSGELSHALQITAHAASESAKAAIEKAGGKLTLLTDKPASVKWREKRNSVKKARLAASKSRKPA
ncbi:MAG: 50S ribosomal protein L15 [Phycisphaerae bacterium]|nr:50S ribosomal protein L15 [Phycisphaerae bacterium]